MEKLATDRTNALAGLLILHVIFALGALLAIISFRMVPILITGLLTSGYTVFLSHIMRSSDAARKISKSFGGKVYVVCMWTIAACGICAIVAVNYLAIFRHPH
ncbi:hypothetical protein DIE23_30560 [Burkholderia sp. Bp9143]|uniref:hypothetical protein n=1 Tax=Burkholderia sp. Bp9143 TaxID=2184574 RepID=UPI000F5A9523|nr:hypothetical protein [Burkholderia sp. Bp9143]RQR26117.1 hypothetical protein DIE23_30560 [Burkholderia sp. Bp9143]